MAFDYQKALQQISNTLPSTEKTEYKYKLVYPGEGALHVRILYNPKSGLITRLINRHNIGGSKIPCLATYTSKQDCPICKVIEQAETAGIKVPYSSKSKVRAIMYAQYHSSSYEIDGVKKGDIILLMVPWKVYTDISKFISDLSSSPEAMNKAFNDPEYFAFTIEHGNTNTDWSGRLNPVITVNSANNREEFESMLENIDSLYDAVNNIHEEPTPEDMNIINEAASQLRVALYDQEVDNDPNTTIVNPNKEPEVLGSAFAESLNSTPSCFGKSYVPSDNTDPTKFVQKVKCKNCDYKDQCKDSN